MKTMPLIVSSALAQDISAIMPLVTPIMTVAGTLGGVLLGSRVNGRKSDAQWVLTKGYESFISYKEEMSQFLVKADTLYHAATEPNLSRDSVTAEDFKPVRTALEKAKNLDTILRFLFRDKDLNTLLNDISGDSHELLSHSKTYLATRLGKVSQDKGMDLQSFHENFQSLRTYIEIDLGEMEHHLQISYYPRPPRRQKDLTQPPFLPGGAKAEPRSSRRVPRPQPTPAAPLHETRTEPTPMPDQP